MDPVTISLVFGAAKTAFEAIKSGIKVGQDIQNMAGDIAKLYGSAAKLTQFEAAKPTPSLFSGVTAEEMAMDIVVKRKQAQKWMAEIKNEFVATYGLVGWAEVEREIVKIRKAQKAAELQQQKEYEEMVQNLKVIGIIFGLILFICFLVVGFFVWLKR
ncbi:MAG: hypothetical protein ACO29C_01490 [Fluviibacter sp.]